MAKCAFHGQGGCCQFGVCKVDIVNPCLHEASSARLDRITLCGGVMTGLVE